MSTKLDGEYHLLDKSVWIEVKQKTGRTKGENPVVSSAGNVYVGKEFSGEDVRVFRRV